MEVVRRPDLEAAQVSYPDFIGHRVMPYYARNQISGSVYYYRWHADISAQYNRDHAALGDISQTVIAANSTTFSCVELRSRVAMGYSQRIGYGSEDGADFAQGRLAKRAWMNALEIKIATALFGSSIPKGVGANLPTTVEKGVAKLRDKGIGRIGLVLSNRNLCQLKSDPIIKERMVYTGTEFRGLEPRNIAPQQIAAILGVDDILVGRDECWYAGLDAADRNLIGLVVLPDEAAEPAEQIQFGRTVYFEWGDSEADKFVMESWHNALNDSEVIDAKGLVDFKVLNPELATIYDITDDTSDSSSSI